MSGVLEARYFDYDNQDYQWAVLAPTERHENVPDIPEERVVRFNFEPTSATLRDRGFFFYSYEYSFTRGHTTILGPSGPVPPPTAPDLPRYTHTRIYERDNSGNIVYNNGNRVVAREAQTAQSVAYATGTITYFFRQALGRITVTKMDMDGNVLGAGFVYRVYNSANDLVDTITTGADGRATTIDLPVGVYRLVETVAVAPYILDPTPIPAEIPFQASRTIRVDVEQRNARGHGVIINVVDEDNNPIPGADVRIYDSGGNLLQEGTADENGVFTTGLPNGNYRVVASHPDFDAAPPEDLIVNNAVSTTTNAGIFVGAPYGFQPSRSITRAELAAAIVRFMDVSPAIDTAQFNDITGHWAERYINTAAQHGWALGYEGIGGRFLPDQPITRAETAALINRMLDRVLENENDLLPDMITWPDNANPNAWYFLDIQEATNSNYYVRKSDGIHKAWSALFEPLPWVNLERPTSRPEDLFR